MSLSLKVSLSKFASSLLPMFFARDAGSMAAGPLFNLPTAIVIWVELVMALLSPWNSNSEAVWGDLHGYQIDKVCLCKNQSGSEHEFIVVDFSHPRKQNMYLRVERSVGKRKDSQATSPSSSTLSLESASDDSTMLPPSRPASPSHSRPRASKLSSSLSSLNEGFSRTTSSLRQAIRHLSVDSLPHASVISSNNHIAADTVTSIDSTPMKAKVIRTIDFGSADRSQRPSLWDFMIITYVVHKDSIGYDLLGRQCFWFADTISAILEKYAETCKGASVKQAKNRAYLFRLHMKFCFSSGCVKGLPIHRRNADDINNIWAQFLSQREVMNGQRKSYEEAKTEGIRKIEELKCQQIQEKQKWERERKEWQERERRLMKEQEEREHRLRKQIAEQTRV